MPLWCEDFSTCSLEDVLRSQAENRVWSKQLRQQASALVSSRLAKDISQADYLSTRDLANKDVTECQRRANILRTQLVRRTGGAPLGERSDRSYRNV